MDNGMLEKIIESEQQAAQIRKQATDQVRAIIADAEQQAERLYGEQKQQLRRKLQERIGHDEALAEREIEARKELLRRQIGREQEDYAARMDEAAAWIVGKVVHG